MFLQFLTWTKKEINRVFNSLKIYNNLSIKVL